MNSLAIKDVSVRFGSVQALSNASVELHAGEALMMVGPNGAGKSTLSRVLLGLVRAETGRVEVDGVHTPINNKLKRRVGYLPEAVAFVDNLRGNQVLGFFARARGIPTSRIDEVLERVDLKYAARRKVRGYSKGMKQRLGLAVAILATPTLLILDEPTGGLDSQGLNVLWSILGEWRDAGRMVLLASHHLDQLERCVDKVSVFKEGRVIAAGAPNELRLSADLPHRVSLMLAHGDATDVQGFVQAVDGWGGGSTSRCNGALNVSLRGNALLELMDIRASYPGCVTGIRVEEPTLEQVYRQLLEVEN